MDNKKKRKITITLSNTVIQQTEKLTTNKSRLIENILLQYIENKGIKTNDIIL